MLKLFLFFIKLTTKIHDKVFEVIIDAGRPLTDKQLHFLFFGVFSFGLLVILQPIIEWLVKKNLSILITFFYVFSLLTVL